MNRREMLLGTALALVATKANADAPKANGPAKMDLANAASRCAAAASACLSHCLSMFASGDSSMSACARAVSDLGPTTQALAILAADGSRYTTALANLVADIAKDCKAECDKHAAMPPCKACADSCAALLAVLAKK
jgi:Cys-rich four helix bundle protein (predicted Tat secretion target)